MDRMFFTAYMIVFEGVKLYSWLLIDVLHVHMMAAKGVTLST
jgi:hypothetical protein